MRLLILSDLHLEFHDFKAPKHDDCDAVILAGDIQPGARGIRWAADNFFIPVLYVMGNHEYYGCRSMIETLGNAWDATDGTNVHLLASNGVVLDNVRFLGTTLWTDFALFGEQHKAFALSAARRVMHDYRSIRMDDGRRMKPEDTLIMHGRAARWLEKSLDQEFGGKTVVITHHCPAWPSVPERFQKDLVTAAFTSDMSRLFGKCDLWVHGHTHDSCDYEINGTRVVCNPRGYPSRSGANENNGFNERFIVEI